MVRVEAEHLGAQAANEGAVREDDDVGVGQRADRLKRTPRAGAQVEERDLVQAVVAPVGGGRRARGIDGREAHLGEGLGVLGANFATVVALVEVVVLAHFLHRADRARRRAAALLARAKCLRARLQRAPERRDEGDRRPKVGERAGEDGPRLSDALRRQRRIEQVGVVLRDVVIALSVPHEDDALEHALVAGLKVVARALGLTDALAVALDEIALDGEGCGEAAGGEAGEWA